MALARRTLLKYFKVLFPETARSGSIANHHSINSSLLPDPIAFHVWLYLLIILK